MKNNYLYAVANIRAHEASLLTQADLEQLINASDFKKASAILADKGYAADGGTDYSAILDKEMQKAWSLLSENAPEAEPLQIFILKNDFQNLKAVLKSEVAGHNAADYLVAPSIIEGSELEAAVRERRFSDLPQYMAQAAQTAYDTLMQTGNGQLCDIVADRACLETMLAFAQQAGDATISEYAETFVLAADLKTAYRCIKTGKGRSFMETAVCGTANYKREALINAALAGMDAFFEFLYNGGFAEFADAIKAGMSAFEKYCDDRIMRVMKKAKLTAFGISPLAAYLFAKMTEIGCVRIILSAKFNGSSAETVRERMRELYV